MVGDARLATHRALYDGFFQSSISYSGNLPVAVVYMTFNSAIVAMSYIYLCAVLWFPSQGNLVECLRIIC